MSRGEKITEPSQQEIQDKLAGLNRQALRAWGCSSISVQAWEKGMENYLRWFKDRGVEIYQDPRDEVWKLGTAPLLSRAERNVKKIRIEGGDS